MMVVTIVFEDDQEGAEFVAECEEEDLPVAAFRLEDIAQVVTVQ